MNSYSQNSVSSGSETGSFPSSRFPVGMGYVPWQQWGMTYEPAKALKSGTIFPCLDLPFLGRRGKS